MKLGCFADAHMGAYPQYADNRLADQQTVLEHAIRVFNNEHVDAILFAGDATHTNKPPPWELLAFLRPLLHAHAPVLAINGNTHDVANADGPIALDLLNRDLYGTLRGSGVLRLSRMPELLEHGNLRVATLPWAPVTRLVAARNGGDRDAINQHAAEALLTVAEELRRRVPEGCASVLLTHFAISGGADGLEAFAREPVLPVEALADLGFDAVVAGHFHRGELLWQDPPVFYCGSPYPLSFGEAGYEHGVWILDVESGRAEARFVPLASRRFVTAAVDVSWLPEDTDDLTGTVAGAALVEDVEGAVLRVRYRCTASQARRIDEAHVARVLRGEGAHRVVLERDAIRVERARVAGIGDVLDTSAAVALYVAAPANGISAELAERMLVEHARYLAERAGAVA